MTGNNYSAPRFQAPVADKKTSGGVGMFGVVFIVLLVLKLCDVAPVGAWSWWWITSPFWGPLALVLGFGVAFYGIALLAMLVKAPFGWLERRRKMRTVVSDEG